MGTGIASALVLVPVNAMNDRIRTMRVVDSAWKDLSSVSFARAMGVVHKFCSRKRQKKGNSRTVASEGACFNNDGP